MAKTRNSVDSGSRKLTDWFSSSQPPSSSQAPISSQPSSSQRGSSSSMVKEATPRIKQELMSSQSALIRPRLAHLSSRPGSHTTQRTATKPMQVAALLKQNRPQSQTQDGMSTLKSSLSSDRRPMKKENAPPLPDVEAISVTSETPTHISISSASVVSLSTSSIVEITPTNPNSDKIYPKYLNDSNTSRLEKRRSPRLGVRESPKKRRKVKHNAASSKRLSSPKKKKSTQNDKLIASDDEAIDLEDAEDVVYVESRPPPPQRIDVSPTTQYSRLSTNCCTAYNASSVRYHLFVLSSEAHTYKCSSRRGCRV